MKRGNGRSEAGRAAILGVDGMPFTLAMKYAEAGIMPCLAKIFQEGSPRSMDSSIPEVSSVAWTSFMTGVNPGRHGIFGFLELKPGTYQYFFPDFQFVKSKTIWEVLESHGKRSVVINVPSTYPAKPLNGMMISGFVAIDLKKATYPSSQVPRLEAMGYRLDVDSEKARESMDAFVADVWATLDAREKALLHFLDNEEWDLFLGVITETDRVHHFLFDAYEDENHPYRPFFIDFYRRIDAIIGKVYERVGREVPFFMLSDHGFTVIEKEVYLNRWLREEGYLKVSREEPKSFEDIGGGTVAFALDPGRIYINVKGKYPRGVVAPGTEYEELRRELKERLMGIEVDGRPVAMKVFLKEELYNGPQSDKGPDLVVLSHRGFDMKGAVHRPSVTGKGIFRGMHTRDDAIFFVNRPVPEGKVDIIDIFPTLLASMNLPPDAGLEGKNLLKS